MDMVIKIFVLFITAASELLYGVPLGFALGLDPWVVGVTSAAGGITAAAFVLLLGEKVRLWILGKRKQRKETEAGDRQAEESPPGKRHKLITRLWERYGVAGLGLMAPILTGVPLGAAIGVTLGAPVPRLFLWLTVGTLIWTAILTIGGALGVEAIESLMH